MRVPRIILVTELDSEMRVLLTPQSRFCHPGSSQMMISPPLPHNMPPRGARQGGSFGSSWWHDSQTHTDRHTHTHARTHTYTQTPLPTHTRIHEHTSRQQLDHAPTHPRAGGMCKAIKLIRDIREYSCFARSARTNNSQTEVIKLSFW